MYPYNYIIPNNSSTMYRNSSSLQQNVYPYGASVASNEDDRFFLAPFLFGGLAGTALGYGIANNNQINRPPCCMQPMPMPMPMPYPQQYTNFNSTNSFYY